MKKKELLIMSIIIIGVLSTIVALYYFIIYVPPQNPGPQIEVDKTLTDEWLILNITKIELEYDTPLNDFKLLIHNGSEYTSWNLTNIMNNTEGPLFVDNDNDANLSPGDSFFIPIDYVNKNDKVGIYHIPSNVECYKENL